MLTSDDIAHHFAVRLVYALDGGLSRAALDIWREWRAYAAQHGEDAAAINDELREVLALRACDGPNGDDPGAGRRSHGERMPPIRSPA